ncbi:MAG: cytochrome c oxidase accessory protein CcoG [Microscillaceae bacterium]|nr:cytochrome c oxidase accessory protein CcoG [Microscillaceae bacterium]
METLEEFIDTEEYRDSIATVDETGKRVWIYPKKPKGRFTRLRLWVSGLLLAVFFVLPFVWVNGQPFFMFNLFERKFILFGNLFMPQDFHLVALAGITFFVFVILFTVVYGRVWCGWACPQTVFMESVFRRIEYWIEGDAAQQRKLNAQPWTAEKIRKKVSKQGIFILFSLLISHTVMAYLIGIDQVVKVVSHPPTQNLMGFIGLMVFTFIFYGVFAYLREQACIAVCPYGRLQGVLLGKDSVVVAYDFERGEPRGKLKRKKQPDATNGRTLTIEDLERPEGDCIDCKLCVQVCPTGIDIRNGTQLECVNCTACIDACDEVMDKIKKPRGLIRYASYNNIVNKTKFKFSPRLLAYTAVLAGLMSLDLYLLTNRTEVEATILRVPGSLYNEMPDGRISNIYNVQIANKTFENHSIRLQLIGSQGEINMAGGNIKAEKNQTTESAFVVILPTKEVKGLKTKIEIEVWSGNKRIETVSTNFLGPTP